MRVVRPDLLPALRGTSLVLALALLLSGCGGVQPDDGEPAGTSGEPPSPSAGGTPTAVPTDLRECPTDKGDVRVPSSVAPSAYEVPTGFAERGGLVQIEPAEGEHEATYLGLDDADGVEVIALVHHPVLVNGPVSDPCGVLDLDEALGRITDHNARSGSTIVAKPTLVEVAGLPAIVEDRDYDGFALRQYWFYGSDDLLLVSCQWTSHRDAVLAGCDVVLSSLELG